MDTLDELVRTGPFVSLTLPIEASVVDAEERMAIRWGNARRVLADAGAPDELLDRVAEAVTDSARARASSVAVVGVPDGPLVVALLQDDVGERATFGPVPTLGPLLEARRAEAPHVVVVADRVGADVWISGASGEHGGDPDLEVEGETRHLHRSHPGGWSQRRFQQRAENTWEQNAAGVAQEVADAADRVGAELIVVTGDVRAVGFLEEHLPEAHASHLRIVEEGGRTDDDVAERVASAAARAIDDLRARRTVEVVERFRTAAGRDLAVQGPGEVLAALSEGRVAVLLVHDAAGDDRTAWSSPDGALAATERATLEQLGVEAVEGRLVDVAVRAALATGAEVELVPAHGAGSPDGNVGAILRG